MPQQGFQPRFSITNAITNALTQIERARGFLEAATLSEQWVRAMGERALVLEAHHTTHIEGTQLTFEQSQRLMRGETVPEADPDDGRELLNYRQAFELVSDYLDSGLPITEGLIREIHQRLVAGVRGDKAMPGHYRLVQNYVVNSATGKAVYTPPPPGDVPPRLFTISEYYDRDRPTFYEEIQGVRDGGMDLTGWLEFFVDGLATQLAEVKQRGERAIHRDILVQTHKLSERQAIAMSHVLEHGALTIQELDSLCEGVNRRSLQRDLKGLLDKGLLLAEGATNCLTYLLGPTAAL